MSILFDPKETIFGSPIQINHFRNPFPSLGEGPISYLQLCSPLYVESTDLTIILLCDHCCFAAPICCQ